MKKNYVAPQTRIIFVSTQDVLTTSPVTGEDLFEDFYSFES